MTVKTPPLDPELHKLLRGLPAKPTFPTRRGFRSADRPREEGLLLVWFSYIEIGRVLSC